MLGDGNIDIIAPGCTVIWRSPTYHKGSGVSVAPVAPPPVACPAPVSPAPPDDHHGHHTRPVVTVPVTVPLPQPAPRPRALRIKLAISWTYDRATTACARSSSGASRSGPGCWSNAAGEAVPGTRTPPRPVPARCAGWCGDWPDGAPGRRKAADHPDRARLAA